MSEKPIFKDLLEHFQAESRKIANIVSETAIHDNKPDLGSLRENAFVDFLRRYIPSRCNVERGGFLFDSEGNKSNQLDIMITTDFTLKFHHTSDMNSNSKTFNCIEGCIAVISMKTNLTKSDLEESIMNLCSIPKIKKFQKHYIIENLDELMKPIPLKIIFAFDGAEHKTTGENLLKFLNEKNIPVEQRPNFVIINDKSVFMMVREDKSLMFTGPKQNPGSYVGFSKEQTNFVGGRALITLLSDIQQIGNIVKEADLHFGVYMNKIKLADDTWTLSTPEKTK